MRLYFGVSLLCSMSLLGGVSSYAQVPSSYEDSSPTQTSTLIDSDAVFESAYADITYAPTTTPLATSTEPSSYETTSTTSAVVPNGGSTDSNTPAEYGMRCLSELGVVGPGQTVKLPVGFSCFNETIPTKDGSIIPTGKMIPVTVDGVDVTEKATRTEVEAKLKDGICDYESPIADCSTYSWTGTFPISKNVQAVFLCRKLTPSGGSVQTEHSGKTFKERQAELMATTTADYTRFNAAYTQFIGLILVNKHNGRTCYFNSGMGSRGMYPIYSRFVLMPYMTTNAPMVKYPSPLYNPSDDSNLERNIWNQPGRWANLDTYAKRNSNSFDIENDCTTCHSHAILHTPWIGRALPAVSDQIWAHLPHRVVGAEKFALRSFEVSTEPVPFKDGSIRPQECTSCHSLYGGYSPKQGIEKGNDYNFRSFVQSIFLRGTSKSSTSWPPGYMMPAGHAETSKQAWNEKYGPLFSALSCCQRTPTNLGCLYRDASKGPLPAFSKGTGPESCLPTPTPTTTPSPSPTPSATATPTSTPSGAPSLTPTTTPTVSPTATPTSNSTVSPTPTGTPNSSPHSCAEAFGKSYTDWYSRICEPIRTGCGWDMRCYGADPTKHFCQLAKSDCEGKGGKMYFRWNSEGETLNGSYWACTPSDSPDPNFCTPGFFGIASCCKLMYG